MLAFGNGPPGRALMACARRNNWGALIIRTGYAILSVLYNYIGLAKDTTAN